MDFKVSRIQHRRGLQMNLPQPLLVGQLGWCYDTNNLYIGGNGTTIAPGVAIVPGYASSVTSLATDQFILADVDDPNTFVFSDFITHMLDSGVTAEQCFYIEEDTQVFVMATPMQDTATLISDIDSFAGVSGATLGIDVSGLDAYGNLPTTNHSIAAALAYLSNIASGEFVANTKANIQIVTIQPITTPFSWGEIVGDINDQTDLIDMFDTKENVFTKGNLVQGAGVSLTGTLTSRLVGSGDITIATTGLEPAFTKGTILAGTNVSLTGTGTSRLVGAGDLTVSVTGLEPAFTKGTILAGTGITLTGTGTSRLVSSGDLTIATTGLEPAFTKGSLIQGAGITLTGTLTGRLVGTGDITVASTSSGDMTNPMTTAGDIIIGGVSGAPTRIGIGTEAYVLTVVTGVPTWTANTATLWGAVVAETGSNRDILPTDARKYIRFTGVGAKTAIFDDAVSFNSGEEFYIANRAVSDNLTLTEAGTMVLNPPKGGTLVLEPGDTVKVKIISASEADVIGTTDPI